MMTRERGREIQRLEKLLEDAGIKLSILTAVWTMAHTGALYDDPGADYLTRRDPERLKAHALNQLQRPGYQVTLDPIAASA